MPAAFKELQYWMLRYRRTWRATAMISFANPALFLIAVGAGLGKLVDHGGAVATGGVGYAKFFAPGLLAAAAMQTAYIESAGPVFTAARERGNYRAAASSPLDPGQIMAGHLLFVAFRVATTSVAIVAVMAAFGDVRSASVLWDVPAATLTGLAFAGPVASFAVSVRRQATLISLFRLGIMPLYFFSGAFFPLSELPRWLRAVAYATPAWNGVDLCRSLSLGSATARSTALHITYLCCVSALGIVVARLAYRRRLQR